MVDIPKKPEIPARIPTGISPEDLPKISPIRSPELSLIDLDQDILIDQIDELDNLLAEKKAEVEAEALIQAQEAILPKLNVGTDGIPVLEMPVTEEGLSSDKIQPSEQSFDPPLESPIETNNLEPQKKDEQIINDIIDKIDKEITEDLDELVLMLKDSIIDEVKTRLLKELKIVKPDFDINRKDK